MRTNLTHYITPAIAAVATAASLASATIAQKPAAEAVNQLTAQEKQAGWTLLFDGKSLNGWRGYKKTDAADSRWKVEGGLLTVDPGTGKDTHGQRDIITTAQFDRFDLTWEWRVAEGGNSGLKYFVLEDQPSAIGHEYQLIDDERHADAKIGPHRQTAALYDVLPAENRPLRPAGQWNQSRVVSNGTTVEHYLNGTSVLQYELDSPALRAAIAKSKFKDIARFGTLQNGFILLQDHGDRVWYRNIKIRRLPPPAQRARRSAAKGVQVVANESGKPRRHHDRRQAVHLVHLPRVAEEAGALSDPDRQRHARHARLPSRPAAARALRSPAPRRPLVQPRRRERARLLEQLLRHPRRPGAEDGDHPSHSASSRPRAAPIAASWRSRWSGTQPRASRSSAKRRASSSAAPVMRAASIGSRRSPRSIVASCSATTRKARSACA